MEVHGTQLTRKEAADIYVTHSSKQLYPWHNWSNGGWCEVQESELKTPIDRLKEQIRRRADKMGMKVMCYVIQRTQESGRSLLFRFAEHDDPFAGLETGSL